MESYGGIFTNRPFELNIKCVFYGFALMLAYWFLPGQNVYLLPVIFIFAYIAMAWYDYLYDCNAKMYSGNSPVGMSVFDSIFKPQRRGESKKYPRDDSLLPDQEQAYLRTVYLFHLIAVVPLLGYIGWQGVNANPKVFPALLAVAGLAGVYHGARLFLIPRETAE